MIRFSAALVAVAIGVLIGGIATSELLLVYIAIAVSAIALVALVIGVVLKREELFGEGQGPVPAAAGRSPGRPAHAGDSRGTVPSSGYVAPPPPAAGAAAGYGVPFGGVAQATSSPGAGLTGMRQGAARHGRPTEPTPPWESAATRKSWTPDRMPAAKDQRAAGGAGVRAPSAWQDTAPVTAAGNWGGAPNADARAATALPRAWAAPPTVPTPVPSDAPTAKPDTGPEAATPSWFGRLGQSAGTGTPTAPPASAPGSGSDWSWSSRDTGTPGGPAAPEEPASSAIGSGDEDDDWPTRYSWLDDETDESDGADEADEGGKAADAAEATVAMSAVGPATESESPAPAKTSGDAETKDSVAPNAKAKVSAPATSAQARDAETAHREPAAGKARDSADNEPADPAGETGTTVTAFRSRKEPEPEAEAPSPASDADQEPGAAGEAAEAEAAPEPKTAAEPAGEPPATAPTADASGTALVAVVRGVPRYHEPDCVLIRFMPEGDLQKLTVPQAKQDGCTPCAACQPAG